MKDCSHNRIFFRQPKAMWSPYLFLHCSHRIALHWSAIDLPCVLYWKTRGVINAPCLHYWSFSLSYLPALKRDEAFSIILYRFGEEHCYFLTPCTVYTHIQYKYTEDWGLHKTCFIMISIYIYFEVKLKRLNKLHKAPLFNPSLIWSSMTSSLS